MKKYLSLFVVLAMVVFLGVKVVNAEDSDKGISTTNIKVEDSDDDKSVSGEKDSDEDEDTETNKAKEERELKREEFKKRVESAREEAKNKLEALREKVKEEKDEAKAKIKELRITGREKALERFDNAISRINELKDKVNAQITKFEAKGVDVVNAKTFVVTSETKLTEAKNKIAEINVLLATSINELTLENKTKLRTLTQETQALIVASHNALKDGIKSLREAIKVKFKTGVKVNED